MPESRLTPETCLNDRLTRRAWISAGSLFLACGALTAEETKTAADPNVDPAAAKTLCKFGLVTDLHHADKPPAGTRHYRETLTKLAEATKSFQEQNVEFVVELGDLIDAADTVETEQAYLKTVNAAFASACPNRHYVLGNHCVDTLTKAEFLQGVGQAASYFSFDHGPIHFVILDACFRQDGEPYGRRNFVWNDSQLPESELEWLRNDLQATTKPVVVFVHQRLDEAGNHAVKNHAQVRSLLEASGKVRAVFQGHSHANAHQLIHGIHYCTLTAMVEGSGSENNGYSIVRLLDNDVIQVQGFRIQSDYEWPKLG